MLTKDVHHSVREGLVFHDYTWRLRRGTSIRGRRKGQAEEARAQEADWPSDDHAESADVEFTVPGCSEDKHRRGNQDKRNMTLVLEADSAVDVTPFTADSVVYLPVPAPADIVSPTSRT